MIHPTLGYLNDQASKLVERFDAAEMQVAQRAYDTGGVTLRDAMFNIIAGNCPATQTIALNAQLAAIRKGDK